MTRITAVTGTSTIRSGSTQLNLGVVKPDGTFIVREIHRHFPGKVSDITRERISASTQGANSGVLGDWVTRDLDFPENAIIYMDYKIKSSSMPMAKRLTFGFKVSEENPYIELLFPTITDRHSTRSELLIQGRVNLMTSDEIKEDLGHIKGNMSLVHSAAIDTLEKLSEEGVMNYWKVLTSSRNAEGSTFLNLIGGTSHEEYPITVKYVLPASKVGAVKPKGKAVKTATGRKVIITSRKRKITLS